MVESTDRWRPTLVVYDPLKAGSIDGTDTVPHDRAIIRALASKYKPNKELRSDPESTIFVGRLSKNTMENDLQEFFKRFGEIVSVHLVRDIVTGFSKCYAFIDFAERRDARDASRANGARIDDKEIIVEMECGRTMQGWKPRRLGGGFCGKKESGQLRFGGNQRPFKRPYHMMRPPIEEFGTPTDNRRSEFRPNFPPRSDSRPSNRLPTRPEDRFPNRGDGRGFPGRSDDRASRARDGDRGRRSESRSSDRSRSRDRGRSDDHRQWR